MSRPATTEDELAVLQRALDRARKRIEDATGITDVLHSASGPVTRGSDEAEKRDRGGIRSRSEKAKP